MPLKQNSIENFIELTSQAEETFSKHAGFRKGRSTTEQIFNCRNLIEKHLESQNLYHNFLDFKKALI